MLKNLAGEGGCGMDERSPLCRNEPSVEGERSTEPHGRRAPPPPAPRSRRLTSSCSLPAGAAAPVEDGEGGRGLLVSSYRRLSDRKMEAGYARDDNHPLARSLELSASLSSDFVSIQVTRGVALLL